MKNRALLAIVLAAAGCELHDGRGQLRLVPETPVMSRSGVFDVRVESDLDGVEAEIFLDGATLGTSFGPGDRVHLDWSRGPEATHALRARCWDGGIEVRSEPLELRVDRTGPQVVSTDPPAGPVRAPNGLEIVITFDEPLASASSLRLATLGGTVFPCTHEIRGSALRVAAPTAVPGSLGLELLLQGAVTDGAGNGVGFGAGPWTAP